MADVLNQIIDKVKESSNILVTVNSNPSVDELSAALGITLFLNKLNKHATAVFSGAVPPAIKFLKPEKTFESTVDSLRDFIIALDKEKADHLRYKVVDDMVKIFITPYRTTINEKDLDFSQGDYNVEMVIAIGVKDEADLDRALESHGRILHDAVVASISLGESTQLGSLDWSNPRASSYSEMLYQLADQLRDDKKLVDEQIATAFLTGIVSATDRFSNAQTSSGAMTAAAQLMAAGANQQLIATKLQEELQPESTGSTSEKSKKDSAKQDNADDLPEPKKDESDEAGSLSISHEPTGDVDEVKDQLGERSSNEALAVANEKLSEQRGADAAVVAEQKLAEQLAAIPRLEDKSNVPSVEELQRDIAASSAEVEQASRDNVVLPPVNPDFVSGPGSPVRGGSDLLAGGVSGDATEQSAAQARKIADERNRVILSHDKSAALSQPPALQSPFNAVSSRSDAEPTVPDVLSAPPTEAQASPEPANTKGATLQPQFIEAPVPALTGSDKSSSSQVASSQDEARAAIDAAFANAPTPGAPADLLGGALPPPLPPPPPMPDFSTLPPPPTDAGTPTADAPLESTLPPAPAPAVPAPNDPAQFRIPGQV